MSDFDAVSKTIFGVSGETMLLLLLLWVSTGLGFWVSAIVAWFIERRSKEKPPGG